MTIDVTVVRPKQDKTEQWGNIIGLLIAPFWRAFVLFIALPILKIGLEWSYWQCLVFTVALSTQLSFVHTYQFWTKSAK